MVYTQWHGYRPDYSAKREPRPTQKPYPYRPTGPGLLNDRNANMQPAPQPVPPRRTGPGLINDPAANTSERIIPKTPEMIQEQRAHMPWLQDNRPEWQKPAWEQKPHEMPPNTVPYAPKENTGTGAGTTGTGGGGYAAGGSGGVSISAQQQSFYAQQQAAAEAAAARQAQLLKEQYDKRIAAEAAARKQQEDALRAGHDAVIGAAQSGYDDATALREQGYADATGDVNAAAERAMQQAFIQKEMAQRYIQQQMDAMGRSGGAAESTLLGLMNDYGQRRGDLDAQRNDDLGDLAAALERQKAADLEAFNRVKAEQEAELQRRLAQLAATSADRVLGYDTSYTDAMMKLEAQKAAQMAALQREQMQMQIKAAQAAQRASSGGSTGGGDAPKGDISNAGRAWMYEQQHKMMTNPFTEKMTEEERQSERQIALMRAYQRGVLSRADAEKIAAQYGL